MHLQTYLAVKHYLEQDQPSGPLLLGSRKDGRLEGAMSKSAINQLVRWLGKKIGVERLSPHDCRHFWAISASEAGRWASLEMQSRYIKRRAIANEKFALSHWMRRFPLGLFNVVMKQFFTNVGATEER